MAIFFSFCDGLGLSLGAKLVSTNFNDRSFIFFCIVFSIFASGGAKQIASHCARTGWRYSKACL